VRERGTQSRRARADETGPVTRVPKSPQPPRGAGYWPAVAIIAVIVATAGWTTVAVMTLNGGAPSANVADASDEPIESFDETDPEFSDEPTAPSNEVPELEALLPTEVAGTALGLQSWFGDTLLADGGPWSESITAFLTSKNKTPADLAAALASDPDEATDNSVGVFRLDGVPTAELRDAMVAAWKEQFPELVVSKVTLDGTEVTRGDFGEGAVNSYWYEKDGLLFDIETSDEALATTIVTSLRDGTPLPATSAAPASAAPPESPAPSPS
jgi:hypothetical protein